VYSTTIEQGEVDNLLNEMREAHGMEVGDNIAGANKKEAVINNGASSAQANDIDEMQKKLDQLKHL
jgi:hypothetical protein